MKAFLMHKDRNLQLDQGLLWNEQALTQDLELNTLLRAMARDDDFLFKVAKAALLSGVTNDPETIVYRQQVLRDCLRHPSIVMDVYRIATEAVEQEKKVFGFGVFGRYPAAVLHSSVHVLKMFAVMLKKLRKIGDDHADKFESEGFKGLFRMLKKELDDEYLAKIEEHLRKLEFRNGVLLSAELGEGNRGTNYVLRKPNQKRQSWLTRMLSKKPPAYTFRIADRDESGARALSELRDRGIVSVAKVAAQSADHVLDFFEMLRTELAFYVGCLNLHERLARKGEPTCFPRPEIASERKLSFMGLYDVCLTLSLEQRVVSNDLNADDKVLVVITGANQGGKSVFLRSIGLAQLMMQSGMFAPAESFSASVCDGLFTHYRREEDASMRSGKLDEELSRMSAIIDHITPNAMVLFNESFAATNEREGSEIARQIVSALVEKNIRVFFVTHLYEFAHSVYEKGMENVVFLRAERQSDGGRSFRLREGEPLQTSYGEDLYQSIFGTTLEMKVVHKPENQ
ncbi:MAG: DNA mismatch repair protein MutS [Bacillota bacterium]